MSGERRREYLNPYRQPHRPRLQRRLLRGYVALPRPRGETSRRANAEAQAENENRAPSFRDVAHVYLKGWRRRTARSPRRCVTTAPRWPSPPEGCLSRRLDAAVNGFLRRGSQVLPQPVVAGTSTHHAPWGSGAITISGSSRSPGRPSPETCRRPSRRLRARPSRQAGLAVSKADLLLGKTDSDRS